MCRYVKWFPDNSAALDSFHSSNFPLRKFPPEKISPRTIFTQANFNFWRGVVVVQEVIVLGGKMSAGRLSGLGIAHVEIVQGQIVPGEVDQGGFERWELSVGVVYS